jgi:hypothetical protein
MFLYWPTILVQLYWPTILVQLYWPTILVQSIASRPTLEPHASGRTGLFTCTVFHYRPAADLSKHADCQPSINTTGFDSAHAYMLHGSYMVD